VTLADQVDYVVGVDTHRDERVLAVVVASTGAVVAQRAVPATSPECARALSFADEHAAGRVAAAVRAVR
jgi:transposase